MTASILLFLAMVLSLALAAFCAGTETGFFSVNRGRILHLAREGGAAAKILQRALADGSSTITSLLVGNNLANVVFSSASAALAERSFPGSPAARAVWSVCAAFAVLYLSEFVPKMFFASRPLSRLVKAARAFRIFSAALSPVTRVAVALTGLFIPKGEPKYKVTMTDLVRILQDRKDGVRLTDFESALITRIIVMRRKGEFITAESLLRTIDEED